jgi:hypothetical protein
MAKPVAEHPDYGCHHELHTADGTVLPRLRPVLHAADRRRDVELPDPPDPPTDLLVRCRAEAPRRRRRAQGPEAQPPGRWRVVTAVLWVVGVLAAWTIAGLGMVLAVCRAIRLADEKEARR